MGTQGLFLEKTQNPERCLGKDAWNEVKCTEQTKLGFGYRL